MCCTILCARFVWKWMQFITSSIELNPLWKIEQFPRPGESETPLRWHVVAVVVYQPHDKLTTIKEHCVCVHIIWRGSKSHNVINACNQIMACVTCPIHFALRPFWRRLSDRSVCIVANTATVLSAQKERFGNAHLNTYEFHSMECNAFRFSFSFHSNIC